MMQSNPLSSGMAPTGSVVSENDVALVMALRAGDQDAFAALVDKLYMPMLRLAMLYVPSRAVAEDVVQEAWLGVLQGLHRFEGRSSLKTWIFRILTNRAKTRGEREHRSIAFSSLQPDNPEADEPTVDAILARPECAWISRSLEQVAQNHAIAKVVPEHLHEVRGRRLAWIEKVISPGTPAPIPPRPPPPPPAVSEASKRSSSSRNC